MSEDDAIIQAVAKDLWPFIAPRIVPNRKGVPWRHVEPGSSAHTQAMDVAKAAIAAYLASLEAIGRVVTVKEPDAAMMKAVGDLETRCAVHNYGGTPSLEEVWEAMLGASPKPPGLGD